VRQLDKRNQEIMSLKEKILQLEGKVPLGQKNEATEAIEENPYDSRGIQEEYVGHKQDPELVGVLKEIAQNCEGDLRRKEKEQKAKKGVQSAVLERECLARMLAG
jgi:hypothetical protein